MVAKEIIDQYLSEIDKTFETQDRAKLFEISNKLFKDTEGRYSYFLGACYLNGWGVEQNLVKAVQLLEKAADNNDNYNYACYLTAIANYRCNNFEAAYHWFCEAEKAGVRDSLALFADSAAGCALNLWNEVRVKVLQSEVTQGAAMVKNYMSVAIELYMEAAEKAPETMSAALYCGFAKLMILMYNMATTGMLDMKVVAFDSLKRTVFAGLEAMQKMMDTEAHDETLSKCVIGAHFIESHGAPLVAEYLRAFLSLLESTRDHSAAAFYRARWHMKRIGEMRSRDADGLLIANIFYDLDDLYKKAEQKYGATVMNMMRSGQLPDVQKSFIPGEAPAVGSCENFMAMYRDVRASASQPAAEKTEEKSGGFLKKFFKL